MGKAILKIEHGIITERSTKPEYEHLIREPYKGCDNSLRFKKEKNERNI